jgi:alkylation response protein AidB-like acyl-CoA dehydrogenase
MTDINPKFGEFEEYRRAVRDLCSRFGSPYWQAIDEKAGYPEDFVKALTEAGWLAALIPHEYGGRDWGPGSGRSRRINRSGAKGACRPDISWARCCGTAPRAEAALSSQDCLRQLDCNRSP